MAKAHLWQGELKIMRFNRRVDVLGIHLCAIRLNISQRYFCPWRAAVIFRKKLNVMSLLKWYLWLLYLYFVYIYWKYVLWLHLFKALEQLNFYFVKKSCLMNVLSKYVGPEKIVCSLSSKMEKVVHFWCIYYIIFRL